MTKAVNDIEKNISKNWNLSYHQSFSHKMCMCPWVREDNILRALLMHSCSLITVFQRLSFCQENLKDQRFSNPIIFNLQSSICLKFVNNIKNVALGLPWWCSGWESACQSRGHGFEPWSGKIPHATEQLGPWATITEPARLEPVLHNRRGCDSERPTHHNEEWPPLATTRESPRTETKTQHSQK